VPVKFVLQIPDDPLPNVVHEKRVEIIADALGEIYDNHGNGDPFQHGYVFFKEDIIKRRFNQKGNGRGKGSYNQHAQEGKEKLRSVWSCHV
jgi:hypothetical protein